MNTLQNCFLVKGGYCRRIGNFAHFLTQNPPSDLAVGSVEESRWMVDTGNPNLAFPLVQAPKGTRKTVTLLIEGSEVGIEIPRKDFNLFKKYFDAEELRIHHSQAPIIFLKNGVVVGAYYHSSVLSTYSD